jgi:GDP-L-fucose synthase
MPTNLYGTGDNYHAENSHVIPALIKRFHDAKISNSKDVIIWGTGSPMREFLHVDDLAKACIHIMNIKKEAYQQKTKKMLSHINIGFGSDISIRELAYKIASIVNYKGNILFDHSKPSGTPRKLLDSSLINELGWQPEISLDEGLKITYEDYKSNIINK